MNILVELIILVGLFFFITGTIGLLRFPDFYSRMHATSKCDTLGLSLIIIGLALYQGINIATIKIIFIAIFVFITNPTGAHAIARAAFKCGIKPWSRTS